MKHDPVCLTRTHVPRSWLCFFAGLMIPGFAVAITLSEASAVDLVSQCRVACDQAVEDALIRRLEPVAPIEDVSVDGIFSGNGYTAVRLLSAGSPLRRIQLANIFGTYRYNVVSFTNHKVHPGSESTFEDISIRGVFCAKSAQGPKRALAKGWPSLAPIWIDAPAMVNCLTISDYHRTENAWPAENIVIEPGATVESLQLNNVSVVNRTPGAIDVLTSKGTIRCLGVVNVFAKAEGGSPRGAIVRNRGTLEQSGLQQVFAINVNPDVVK